jgi:hypothetical protein
MGKKKLPVQIARSSFKLNSVKLHVHVQKVKKNILLLSFHLFLLNKKVVF